MFRKAAMVVAGLLTMSSLTYADTGVRKNQQVFQDISKAVNHYTMFTLFDSVDIGVKDGIVTLTGDVTMPYKSKDIERLAAKVDGVRQVNNEIHVLPVSRLDDQLRYRVARAFFANPSLFKYEIGANPSIHITVDHGHVTLTGVVNSSADQQLATILANQFPAFSVTNKLKTETEVRTALEHLD